jgi:hypothetical protein
MRRCRRRAARQRCRGHAAGAQQAAGLSISPHGTPPAGTAFKSVTELDGHRPIGYRRRHNGPATRTLLSAVKFGELTGAAGCPS